jgi:predicted O-methyltransferase YrrM
MFVAALRKLIGRIWSATTGSGSIALQESSEPKRVTAEQANVAVGYSSTSMVAYDENLLERSRTQWQFGDWASLAKLDRDTLQHHPDRAKLALLAAAGHQQLGDQAATRQFTRLAQDWGCGKKLIAQVLLAGAHNTLAKVAAAAGQVPRALKHFQYSIATGTPNTDLALATQARVAHQWQALGMAVPMPALAGVGAGAGTALDVAPGLPMARTAWPVAPTSPPQPEIAPALQALTAELQQQRTDLSKQIEAQQAELRNQATKQNKDLFKVSEHLQNVVKKELLNAIKQLEAFLNVQSALSGGDLIPGLHGWPISPDLAAFLIELIRANDYDLVIEFGSGTSTVVMAKALAQMRHRREGKVPLVQVAFEHLETHHAQTQAQLRAAGLADAATVHLAPLAPYQAANGKTYPYYTCQRALQALKASYDKPTCRALVLVNGPPASTGEHARYPAVSAVLASLPHAAMDILLDDLIREDEQQVARMWQDDLKAAGREAVAEVREMEKGTCLIRVQRLTPRTAHV